MSDRDTAREAQNLRRRLRVTEAERDDARARLAVALREIRWGVGSLDTDGLAALAACIADTPLGQLALRVLVTRAAQEARRAEEADFAAILARDGYPKPAGTLDVDGHPPRVRPGAAEDEDRPSARCAVNPNTRDNTGDTPCL